MYWHAVSDYCSAAGVVWSVVSGIVHCTFIFMIFWVSLEMYCVLFVDCIFMCLHDVSKCIFHVAHVFYYRIALKVKRGRGLFLDQSQAKLKESVFMLKYTPKNYRFVLRAKQATICIFLVIFGT